MPTWGQLLQELNGLKQRAPASSPGDVPSPWDVLRRKYMAQLAERTGRAVIVYASAFLEGRQGLDAQAISIHLGDVQGFMEACSNLEERELDLFLHSLVEPPRLPTRSLSISGPASTTSG